MKKIIGVDGGGSKTLTVITDEEGNLLGSGISGCGNYQVNGIKAAMANIYDSIHQALANAHLKVDDIDFVEYGLAGADRPKDLSILCPALAQLPFQKWNIVCDTMEGLRAGSPENTGVVLVCGSGSNAAGRNKEGKTVQTGGFGYLFGDGAGAGGKALAVETFRTAIRSWELREKPTILTVKVPESLGYMDMEEMINDFLDNQIKIVPDQLTKALHNAANEQDLVAIQILESTGKELGMAANSVIKRLGEFEDPIPIVLIGSVLQKGKNPYLLQALKETVENEGRLVNLLIPKIEPVFGAVLLAMDHLNIPSSDTIYKKFESQGREKLAEQRA
jgi:N-acetylglucosamine kinase-like BadF-type ATPase